MLWGHLLFMESWAHQSPGSRQQCFGNAGRPPTYSQGAWAPGGLGSTPAGHPGEAAWSWGLENGGQQPELCDCVPGSAPVTPGPSFGALVPVGERTGRSPVLLL